MDRNEIVTQIKDIAYTLDYQFSFSQDKFVTSRAKHLLALADELAALASAPAVEHVIYAVCRDYSYWREAESRNCFVRQVRYLCTTEDGANRKVSELETDPDRDDSYYIVEYPVIGSNTTPAGAPAADEDLEKRLREAWYEAELAAMNAEGCQRKLRAIIEERWEDEPAPVAGAATPDQVERIVSAIKARIAAIPGDAPTEILRDRYNTQYHAWMEILQCIEWITGKPTSTIAPAAGAATPGDVVKALEAAAAFIEADDGGLTEETRRKVLAQINAAIGGGKAGE